MSQAYWKYPKSLLMTMTLITLGALAFSNCFGAVDADASRQIGVGVGTGAGQDEQRVRLSILKSMGVGILRIDEGEWRDFEVKDNVWNVPSSIRALLDVVRLDEFPFRYKSAIGALQAPPKWFLQSNPDSEMVGSSGAKGELPITSSNVLSYWYPKLKELLVRKDNDLFALLKSQGYLAGIAYLIVPGGPAGEPIYPAPWTTSDPTGPARFWFYAKNAQDDFRTKMLSKYKTIEEANIAWHSNYADWHAVQIPLPGTSPGPMWSDILIWYRDSKRLFFHWQIDHYQSLVRQYWPSGPRPQLVVLVPGQHFTAKTWQEAVASGGGNDCIRSMCDSTFLLDEAQRAGAAVQYTGMPNLAELAFLHSYIVSHDYSVKLWGENVGSRGDTKDLGEEILLTAAFGQEYIGDDLFDRDQVTTTKRLTDLKGEFLWLRSMWAHQLQFSIVTNHFSLAESGCVVTDIMSSHRLCLINGNLVLQERQKVIWSSTKAADAVAFQCTPDKSENYTAVFQGDGNLVVYCGNKALWASNTSGRGTAFHVSEKNPYISIVDNGGGIVWEPTLIESAQ